MVTSSHPRKTEKSRGAVRVVTCPISISISVYISISTDIDSQLKYKAIGPFLSI